MPTGGVWKYGVSQRARSRSRTGWKQYRGTVRGQALGLQIPPPDLNRERTMQWEYGGLALQKRPNAPERKQKTDTKAAGHA